MINLTETKFFSLLQNEQEDEDSISNLESNYREFSIALMNLCRETTDCIFLMQKLGFTRVELLYLQEKAACESEKKYGKGFTYKESIGYD